MQENAIVLKLTGRINAENSEAIKQELQSELAGKDQVSVVFDADELVYISSAGLRMLLQMKKAYPDMSIINVHPKVYEILQMTGFTEIMNIEKAYRSISVEGCEVLGEGANGKVYRVDRETVVKIYKDKDALAEIRYEQEIARLALILGIPTAISYDIVRVDENYGAVFELLNAKSFSNILAEQPEKTDWCVGEAVHMLKQIHHTTVPDGKLSSIKQTALEWAGRMKSCLPAEQGQKLMDMISAVPETDSMIHGDFHTKNIVISGNEVLLIDMDTLSTGHPVFELGQMYCSFVGFYEVHPEEAKGFIGFDADTAKEFWRKSLRAYLDTEDEQTISEAENKIRCVAYVRLIDWSMRHHKQDDNEAAIEREFWRKELMELLDKTNSLFEETEKEAEETEESRAVPADEVSVCEAVLRSRLFWRTDLHIHTTISDGTDTPKELLTRVRKAGIPLFSVTDHDSVKGTKIIRNSLAQGDPYFITGVEFSCRDSEGRYHILGYGFDPDAYSIQKLVKVGHEYRMKKLRARLDFLNKEFHISFPEEAVRHLYDMDNPGKPHLGNLMVKYGIAPTKEIAISKFLNSIRFLHENLQPEEAIVGILAAGGIPVLAHPSFGSGDQLIIGKAMELRLKKLMHFGLKGVEAFYSGFSANLNREILSLASKYDLYVTAGSDYHGKNKEVVLGNTGMDSSTVIPDGFRRFLQDVTVLTAADSGLSARS